MFQTEIEWLTDENWSPTSVKVFRGKEELTDEGFDDMQSRLYGYENVSQMNAYNYSKDMLCKINYGINCKRNK